MTYDPSVSMEERQQIARENMHEPKPLATTSTDMPHLCSAMLAMLDKEPQRGGLEETPERWAKSMLALTSGTHEDPADVLKVFDDGAENYDAMVMVRGIPFYSLCEHHVLPFFGIAAVGYIPNGKIVGLSKMSRVVDILARRLQVQERLTTQIADVLEQELQPLGVGVVLQCRHLCMEARGVRQQGHETLTSALRGVILNSTEARAEFFRLSKD